MIYNAFFLLLNESLLFSFHQIVAPFMEIRKKIIIISPNFHLKSKHEKFLKSKRKKNYAHESKILIQFNILVN